MDQLNKHAAGRRGRMHVRAQEPRWQAVWKAICALHDEVHIPDGSFRGIDTEKPEMNLASDTSGYSKVPGMMAMYRRRPWAISSFARKVSRSRVIASVSAIRLQKNSSRRR